MGKVLARLLLQWHNLSCAGKIKLDSVFQERMNLNHMIVGEEGGGGGGWSMRQSSQEGVRKGS